MYGSRICDKIIPITKSNTNILQNFCEVVGGIFG
jgi:hypothetical protein